MDSASGDINDPFKSLSIAVEYARNKYPGIWKKISLREGRYYLDETVYFGAEDSNLIISNYNNEMVELSGSVLLPNLKWTRFKTTNNKKKIHVAEIPSNVNISSISGLRVNGSRAIRARYPNANPEEGFGSDMTAESWFDADPNPKPDELFIPDEPLRNDSFDDFFQHYNLGIGGICDNFDPPAGYWCSTKVQGGGANTYRIPHGLIYQSGTAGLPNAPYANASGAIIQAWRRSHWASWMFAVGDIDFNSRRISFERGGFQG